MIWFSMMLACGFGGNNPPKFQQFNDIDVRYLFGIAFLPFDTYLSASTGEQVDFDIKVRDSDGDDISLFFPSAPVGLHFSSDAKTGYWQVPEEPIAEYAPFQIVAVDEHGASDVLFVDYTIDNFLYDTGDFLSFFTTKLYGEANVENGWSGTIHLFTDFLPCQWTWTQSTAVQNSDCEYCTKAWTIQLNQGEETDGSCEELGEELNTIEEIKIGWAPEAIIDGVTFVNPIFHYIPEEGWRPNGRGILQGNRLSFEISLR